MKKNILAGFAALLVTVSPLNAKPLAKEESAAIRLSLTCSTLNSIVAAALRRDNVFTILEPGKPVLSASGKGLLLSNLRYGNAHGYRPVVQITPFKTALNAAALKLENFSMDGEPPVTPEKASGEQKARLATQVYAITDKLTAALNAARLANLVVFTYDRQACIIYARFQPQVLSPFASGVALRRFDMADGTLTAVADNGGSSAPDNQPCGLLAGQGLANKILKTMKIPGLTFDISPGGVSFAANGLVLSGKGNTGVELPKWLRGGKLAAHFTATGKIQLPRPNTVRLTIASITVHKIYRGAEPLASVPGALTASAQDSLINLGLQGAVKDKNLARHAWARQENRETLALELKPESFVHGAAVTLDALSLNNGVLTAGFSVK
ncbi:MAG: hypothetical protein PHW69_02770 [Elusimicrobiaceae bacterium]|nr:hypothetical protein [Elusimicrobiaceae bacterium]